MSALAAVESVASAFVGDGLDDMDAMLDMLDMGASRFAFGLAVCCVPDQIQAPTARITIAARPIHIMRRRGVEVVSVLSMFCMAHLSWQAGSDCLFESNARRIRVDQDIRISGFDIDVTALLSNDIQQSRAPIPVGLSNDIQIVACLIAYPAPVDRDSCFCAVEPDKVL